MGLSIIFTKKQAIFVFKPHPYKQKCGPAYLVAATNINALIYWKDVLGAEPQ